MLVIRLQRTGRSGHAQFRVVVQDSRRTPTSGKIVASLGYFNPHTKTTQLDKEKADFYMKHGAQPSDRAARLLKAEGVKLPKWVQLDNTAKRAVRNPEKRRSTRPAEPVAEKPSEPASEDATAPEQKAESTAPADETVPAEPETATQEQPETETAEAAVAEEPVQPAASDDDAKTDDEATTLTDKAEQKDDKTAA